VCSVSHKEINNATINNIADGVFIMIRLRLIFN